MPKILNRLEELQEREKIIKYTKYSQEGNSNITQNKKKKIYDYYRCDYCNDEINVSAKKDERIGGIVVFPHTLTKRGKVTLCLCNKCLNNAIKEFIE